MVKGDRRPGETREGWLWPIYPNPIACNGDDDDEDDDEDDDDYDDGYPAYSHHDKIPDIVIRNLALIKKKVFPYSLQCWTCSVQLSLSS